MLIILQIFLILFLILPVMVLLGHFTFSVEVPWLEVVGVLWFTIKQALVSAGGALMVGTLGATGLCAFVKSTHFKALKFLIFAPNVFPVLFIILSTFNFFHFIGGFPLGFIGIVILHILLNSGIVALILCQKLENEVGGILELVLVEGASRRQIFLPLVRLLKGDLVSLFFFVFCICFGSFAIPLIVSGGWATTMEVFIYEQIKINHNWGLAIFLSLLQAITLFLFSLFIFPKSGSLKVFRRNLSLVSWSWAVIFPLVPSFVLFVGLLFTNIFSWENIYHQLVVLGPSLWKAMGFTFINGFLCASLVVGVLCGVVYTYPSHGVRRFLYGYSVPSTVLIGFSLLFLGSNSGFVSLIKISFGCAIIFLPVVFRLEMAGQMPRLCKQFEVARALGASPSQIFFKILWPQFKPTVVRAGQLSGLWAMGDFALSSLLASSSFTVPLIMRDLIASYQLDFATVLCWILVLLSVLLYWSIEVVFNVRN